MQVLRLYSDAAGDSHWEVADITLAEREFAPPAKSIEVSDPEPVRQMMFLRLKAGWDEPVHPTPVRQRLVCLAGRVRTTASDGEVREIGPGDIWDMEDTTGPGHQTAVLGDEDFEAFVVQYG